MMEAKDDLPLDQCWARGEKNTLKSFMIGVTEIEGYVYCYNSQCPLNLKSQRFQTTTLTDGMAVQIMIGAQVLGYKIRCAKSEDFEGQRLLSDPLK